MDFFTRSNNRRIFRRVYKGTLTKRTKDKSSVLPVAIKIPRDLEGEKNVILSEADITA